MLHSARQLLTEDRVQLLHPLLLLLLLLLLPLRLLLPLLQYMCTAFALC
jgi:hypothetical protein